MKRYKIIVEPRAKQEIQSAIKWYNKQQKGLGVRFHEHLKSTFESVRNKPHYQVRYSDVHCVVIRKFPYMIHFRVDEEGRIARVYGVIHTSLNPDEAYLHD